MERTLPKGHASLLSRSFRYVPATSTNLAQTFARIRRQLEAQAPTAANVHPLPRQKVDG